METNAAIDVTRELQLDTANKALDTAIMLNEQMGLNFVALYGTKEDSCTCREGRTCGTKTGKHPIGNDWPNRLLSTRSELEEAAESFQGCNFGLPCGSGNTCGYMKLLGLDFDKAEGKALLETWISAGLIPQNSIQVETPNNGAHVYLWIPSTFELRNRVGSLIEGLDIRFNRAQLVSAGSYTPKGMYKFKEGFGPGEAIIHPAPPALIDKLLRLDSVKPSSGKSGGVDRITEAKELGLVINRNSEISESLKIKLETMMQNKTYSDIYHRRNKLKEGHSSGPLRDDSRRQWMLAKEAARQGLSRQEALDLQLHFIHEDLANVELNAESPVKCKGDWAILDQIMHAFEMVDCEQSQTESIKKTLCISSAENLITTADTMQIVKKPLPYEVLEPILGNTIDAICEYTSTGPEYVLGHVLAALGSAPGLGLLGRIRKGMHVRTNIYHLLLAPTGSNKSSPLKLVKKPFEDVHELKKEHFLNEMKYYKVEKAKFDRAMRKTNDDNPIIIPTRPIRQRVLFEDFTEESLIKALSECPNGGLIGVDEFVSVLNRFGQYKGGAGGDRQLLLKAHDNDSHSVERVKHDDLPVFLKELFLGVTGTMQPVLFDKYRVNCTHGDGWWDRFLITATDEMKVIPLTQIVDDIHLGDYHTLIKCLLRHRTGEVNATVLEFDTPAFDLYSSWHLQNQKEYKNPAFNQFMRGFRSKSNTIGAKLALLFQACENVKTGEEKHVSYDNVTRAIVIMEAFRNQRECLFQELTVSEEDERIKTAWDFVKNNGGHASYKDFYDRKIAGCIRLKDTKEFFELLCDTGKFVMGTITGGNNRTVPVIKLV